MKLRWKEFSSLYHFHTVQQGLPPYRLFSLDAQPRTWPHRTFSNILEDKSPPPRGPSPHPVDRSRTPCGHVTQHSSPRPVPPSHLSPSAPRTEPAHAGLSKGVSRDSEPQACSVSLGIQLHLSSKLLRHLGQTRKLPSKGPRPVGLPGDLGPRFPCVSFLLHQMDNLLRNYGVGTTLPLPVLFLLRPHHDSRRLSNTDYVPCTGQRAKVDSVLTPLFNPGNASLRLTDKETATPSGVK